MREILFRAKVKDKEELLGKGFPIDENGNLKSEWVFGVPIPRYPDLFLAWNEACNEYEEVNIIPETVGQYTGMTDKNGNEIFEGDIISTSSKLIGAVEWNNTFAKYIVCYNQISGNWFDFEGEDCFFVALDCVIIGNIHDNPELLQD